MQDVLASSPCSLRFDAQHRVARDPSSRIALLCGRRAGKTEELVFHSVEACESEQAYQRPVRAIFVGLSKASAREIFFAKFKSLNAAHGWGYAITENPPKAIHPENGSEIMITGSDERADLDKWRGTERLALLMCDEAGSWREDYMRYALEESVGPALKDIGGRTIISGTPGPVLDGFWWRVSTGQVPGWSVHRWNVQDNPYMPRGVLEDVMRENAWTWESLPFRREWLGEWVRDESFLVFPFDAIRNVGEPPAAVDWATTLAVDFGVVHNTAFVVLGTHPHVREVWVLHAEQETGLAPSQAADRIRSLMDTWKVTPMRLYGDVGGLGKAHAQEMWLRHQVVIQCAEKKEKLSGIEFVADALKTGALRLAPAIKELQRELSVLQWDERHIDIAPGQSDDLSMALVYGYRSIRHVYVQPPAPRVEPVWDQERPKRTAFHRVDLRR